MTTETPLLETEVVFPDKEQEVRDARFKALMKKLDKSGYRGKTKCEYCDLNFPPSTDEVTGRKVYATQKLPNGLTQCATCQEQALLNLQAQEERLQTKRLARVAKKAIRNEKLR